MEDDLHFNFDGQNLKASLSEMNQNADFLASLQRPVKKRDEVDERTVHTLHYTPQGLRFGEPLFDPVKLQQRIDELAAIEWAKEERVPSGLFRVCVSVDREFENVKRLQGADGQELELEIDPAYNPTHYAKEWGTVVARPIIADEQFAERHGAPCEVLAGDKVYFHYHAITPEYRYEVDGRVYYLLPYDMLYCVVRQGRILPLSDYVLTQPVVTGVGEERSATGIILNHNTEERLHTQFADVAIAPTHKRGTEGIVPGRRVVFLNDADLPLVVEGTMYFIMRASEIIGFQDPS